MSALQVIGLARATGVRLSAHAASLVIEAELPPSPQLLDALRAHKPEVLDLLCDERRAVVMWINDHFRSMPLGQCAYCGRGSSKDDPFVALFVGGDRADIHTSCHPEWIAERETDARIALGIDLPKQRRNEK